MMNDINGEWETRVADRQWVMTDKWKLLDDDR